ncbi:MAG: hypothetical protein JSS91_00885 [Bacteroidetes bacterium]|nr:hypothetical protein [Bacteroidota bacterium]
MTQLQQVINQLEATGSVSRNWCLQRYNTRLGARIIDLKRMGWEFKTTRKDGDYIYTVISKPRNNSQPEVKEQKLFEFEPAKKFRNPYEA